MGKIHFFTKEQEFIFDQVVKEDFFSSNFYFTGGTALSSIYLNHRFSEDLDFFSEKKFDESPILEYFKTWAKEFNFTFRYEPKEIVHIFYLSFPEDKLVKVDFGYYPYKRAEKRLMYGRVEVDSLLDIAINKFASINQRSKVKDFVDLYFLLKKFTIWDLIEGVRVKFRMEVEPWVLATDLLVVEEFENLPKMIKPLTLVKLKKFFSDLAKKLARKVVV